MFYSRATEVGEMISSWVDYDALFQRAQKEMKAYSVFISAVVTRTDGLLLVSDSGTKLHWPEFNCGIDRLPAHFAASLLDSAKLGDWCQLRDYLCHCTRLEVTRDKNGQVEITVSQINPPIAE